MFGKKIYIPVTAYVLRERLSMCVRACVRVCVRASFPFGFEGGMWDLILLVLDHYLSYYFLHQSVV